uniref:Uncharacterized protein n=1 Tax=Timema bartmani TaxID=61472 RepID=A0A7R9F504_9NEOP|nr:unnamed protein product [Timema bartmani]
MTDTIKKHENTQYSGSQPFYSPQGQSSTAVSYTPTHTQTVYTYAAPGYIQQPGSVQVREGSPKQAPHGVYLGHTGALPAHTQQALNKPKNQDELKTNQVATFCSGQHVITAIRPGRTGLDRLARYNSPTLLRWNTRRGPLDREYGGNRYHYGLTKTSGIHQPRPLRTSHQHDYKTGKEWRVESSIPNQGIQSQIANRGWFNSQPSKREEGVNPSVSFGIQDAKPHFFLPLSRPPLLESISFLLV